MKKLLFTLLIAFIATIASAQSKVEVKKEGNTFIAEKTVSTTGYTQTDYYYQDTDGITYQIYTHTISKGENQGVTKCYIRKTSKKSGKEYWKEIPVKPEDLK